MSRPRKPKAKAPPRVRGPSKSDPKRYASDQRGQPPFEPTPEQRKKVEAYAGYGIPQEEICLLFKADGVQISKHTLAKHFDDELLTGFVKASLGVSQTLHRQAVGAPAQYNEAGKLIRAEVAPNLGAIVWWEKTRRGMREPPQDHNHRGAVGSYDLTKVSDGDLRRLEDILAPAAAPVGNQGGDNPPRR
jgi:hypothetical protein